MRALALLIVLAVTSTGQGLKDVRAIFVDSLGDADGAATVREKIIKQLAKSQVVSMVSEREKADAILTARDGTPRATVPITRQHRSS